VSDDYLWDGSGEPDPAVERLERVLSPLRSERPAPELPATAGRRSFGGGLAALAAAAAFLIAVSGLWLTGRPPRASWEVTRLASTPSGRTETRAERLRVGEWLETGESSRARVKVGTIGEVDIEPRTRLRLVDAGAASHRLRLDHGVLHARIWAPPGRFFVVTPSAVAVDLGCEYTLAVDETGAGLLQVSSGWVGFEQGGRESFVPRGAACAMRPGTGPGTPYYEDATEELKRALSEVDFAPAVARADALRRVLATARPKDALSLWHLLARRDGEGRPAVYDRLAELVAPPDGVTREGVLAGDRRMLDRWWEALGLGAAGWWRQWLTHLPSHAS
jgi:FecR-like protein